MAKESQSDWRGLPVEILHAIFQQVLADRNEYDLCSFVHVCKAWLRPAQTVLYTNVHVESTRQSLLGFDVDQLMRANIPPFTTLLLSNSLPNLEEFYDNISCTYMPVLDALLESRLKRLRKLNTPTAEYEKSELANYITCVFLLKDRLENILVSDKFQSLKGKDKKIFFNRIYEKLHQFGKLKAIEINKTTNDEIQTLEHVIETCKSLNEITFTFCPPTNNVAINSNTPIDSISNLTPRPSISTLTATLNATVDYKMLLYIMQVFPHLRKLSLSIECNTTILINRQLFSQFLYYISKIKSFNATNLRVGQDDIVKVIGGFWNATSTSGSECVRFYYTDHSRHETRNLLHLSNESDSKGIVTELNSPTSNLQWMHTDFIEQNGKYIRNIHFGFRMKFETATDICKLPPQFMPHTLKHCPGLEELAIRCCNLRRFHSPAIVDFSKVSSLNNFYLDECNLYDGMLEQLSLLLKEISQLRLNNVKYCFTDDEPSNNLMIEIIMPHTSIDLIIFEEVDIEPGNFIYVKVYVESEPSDYYYKFDTKYEKSVKVTSNEYEYNQAVREAREHVYVHCQTHPEIQINLAT